MVLYFVYISFIVCGSCALQAVSRNIPSLSESYTTSFRLHPGDDLKDSLSRIFSFYDLNAASVVACVGSLKQLNLRLANSEEYLHVNDKKYEIVSLSGTIARDAGTCDVSPHLHMSVADSTGAVVGGHLMSGNLVYTTAEVTLSIPKSHEFVRLLDNSTGYDELEVFQYNDKVIESIIEHNGAVVEDDGPKSEESQSQSTFQHKRCRTILRK